MERFTSSINVPALRRVAVLVGVTILVGGVYGASHFLIPRYLSQKNLRYTPVTLFTDGDEAQLYAPLVQGVGDGTWHFGDVALREHMDDPSPLPPLGPLVLGSAARLVGVERVWILVDLIFPPLIFLLACGIIYLLTKSFFVSVSTGIIFIFFREIASLFPFSKLYQLKAFLASFKPLVNSAVATRLPFDRLMSPEWTFIPLGLFLFFLICALKYKKNIFTVCAGIFYGALFYSYPFDWIAVSLVLGVSFFLFLFRRDYIMAKMIFFVAVFGGIVSIPYWVNVYQLMHLAQYHDLLSRTGLEVGRHFRLFLLPHYIVWLGLSVWLLKSKKNIWGIVGASLFIGAFLTMNVQMVTGYVPQPDHFLRYPLAFSLLVAYVIAGIEFAARYPAIGPLVKRIAKIVLVLACVLVIVRSVGIQIAYARSQYEHYTLPPAVDDSFKWIRENLPSNSVMLSPSVVTNSHLLMFTPVKVFVPSSGAVSTASNQELVERFVVAAKLFGVSDDRIKELFSRTYLEELKSSIHGMDTQNSIAAHLFHYGLYAQTPNFYFGDRAFRDFEDVEKAVVTALGEWHRDQETMRAKFSFEYIYVGPEENKHFTFLAGQFPGCLKNLYTSGGVSIYRICD